MRKLPFILGPLVILYGGWIVLMVLGFATMIDPSLPDDAWRREYLRRVFQDGLGSLVMGVGLIVAGFWIAAGGGRDGRSKPSRDRSA